MEGLERERESLLVYVRARVRAPAMLVVGVREEGVVVRSSRVRAARRVDWMCRNGR